VAIVTPVGVEEAFGAVRRALMSSFSDIGDGIAESRAVGVPRTCAGADHEGQTCAGDILRVLETGAILLIFPVEKDDILGQLGQESGMPEDDIGPHVHPSAVPAAELVKLKDVVEINARRADAAGSALAAALAEFPRLIAADVEVFGLEDGDEFVIELGDEFGGARVGWAEGGAAGPATEAGQFGKVNVMGEDEGLFHVAEAGEGADEADVMKVAVGLKLAQLRWCKGAVAFADGWVAFESECVLDVELEFVYLPVCQPFDESEKRCELWHFTARAVVVDTAATKVGPVVDGAAGEGVLAEGEHVAKGLNGVVCSGVGRREDRYSSRQYLDAIGFRVGDGAIMNHAKGRCTTGTDTRFDLMELLEVGGKLGEREAVGR